MPYHTPTTVDGVEAVCSGVGVSNEDKARWNKYPLKVVVSGKDGQFLAGEQVAVTKDGHELVSVICDGPWVLFKLAPGEYGVRATVDGWHVEGRHVPKSSAKASSIFASPISAAVSVRSIERGRNCIAVQARSSGRIVKLLVADAP